jgi:putative Ca2+/H+ antiporter (TMEM165/GDT1 family)
LKRARGVVHRKSGRADRHTTLTARYHSPLAVFSGATHALWAVAGRAVFVGNRAGKLLDPELTKKVAAVIFVLLGIALVAGLL